MIYDYKSDERIQCAIFECFCPLMEDIKDEFDNLRRDTFLNIFAPAWIGREIFSRINEEIDESYIDSESDLSVLEDDNNEVNISLNNDGNLFVMQARGNNGNLLRSFDMALNYVYDGFKEKDVKKLSESDEFILVFGFEDEDTFCDEPTEETLLNVPKYDIPDEFCTNNNMEIKMDTDGDMHGFTVTESGDGYQSYYSFYSTEKLDMDGTMKILKALGFKE